MQLWKKKIFEKTNIGNMDQPLLTMFSLSLLVLSYDAVNMVYIPDFGFHYYFKIYDMCK